MHSLDSIRSKVNRCVKSVDVIAEYWEILAALSRHTGHTVKELHEIFEPLRTGVNLFELQKEKLKRYVRAVLMIATDLGLEYQGKELKLWE